MDYLIVGLGNPGSSFIDSPHNVGFMAIDILSQRLRIKGFRKSFKSLIAASKIRLFNVTLCKPQTFMNLSGEAVAPLLRSLKLPQERLIVIYDDIDLPLGTIRIRASGSHGGHKGMKSIIESLETSMFPRIRIGIDMDMPKNLLVDYLLTPLYEGNLKTIKEMCNKASDAVIDTLNNGINKTMSIYNKRTSP